jgi:hypothetical protein
MNLISEDFIQEFKTTQAFSAEPGRASAGSVNVITKSGTNEFHGALFEFLRNDKLDARNFFWRRKRTSSASISSAPTWAGASPRQTLSSLADGRRPADPRPQVTGTVPTQLLDTTLIAANPAYAPILNLMPPVTQPIAGATPTVASIAAARTLSIVRPPTSAAWITHPAPTTASSPATT